MLRKLFILIITVALLEFLLEGAGYILTIRYRSEIKRRLLISRSSDVKIICLGDSNTFGSESSYGRSYPEQLERLLNREIKGHEFVVYNLGVIGENSFQVRAALKENILTYNPEYIVVLVGVNNRWNISGRRYKIGDDLELRPGNKILIMFDNLRLVKLVRLIAVNIKHALYRESGGMGKVLMESRHTFLDSQGKWALSEEEHKVMDYWLRQDLAQMASIAARYKKKLIFLTYPTQDWQDEIRKSISEAFGVPLIDNYSLFRKLDNISEYLGATGGHPNDKGYSLMAQEVFNFIKQDLR